jgi:gliding motility-associated-like protein
MENDNGDRWLVDDIKVDSQCLTPTGLSAVPLSTSATVSWTSPNPGGPWEIEYGPAGFVQGTGTVITATTNSTNLTPLTSLTGYTYYVRTLCDVDNPSPWSTSGNFTTTALPPVCGGNFIDTGGVASNYANSEDYVVTICPTNPGEYVTVTFSSFNTEANWDKLYVYDGNSTAAPQISSGNGPGNGTVLLPGAFWGTTIPGPFEATSTSGCLTFRFVSDTSFNFPGWTSNIVCQPYPTCRKPTNITSTVVSSSSIAVSWTNNAPSATQWEVIAVPAGSGAPTAAMTGQISTNPTTHIYTGLNSQTAYDFYVRAICAAGTDVGPWSTIKTTNTTQPNYCAGDHFYDSGGATGNYLNDENRTWTICPENPGDVVTVYFNSFNLNSSINDYLVIYDGNNAAGTPVGTYYGTSIISSYTATSPTGCLTFKFVSNATLNAEGWDATILCGPPCPSIISVLDSTSPAVGPQNIIRICQGDAVQFNGSGTFAASGVGATYQWDFDDSTTASGQNVSHVFTNPGVYLVNLTIIDVNGCRNSNRLNQKIYVSTTPTISTSVVDDELCAGQSTNLTGNVVFNQFVRACAPPVSGTTFLPDGAGNSYISYVPVDCFPFESTITSASQITSVCIDMEHSYLGDLELRLVSPNGQSIILKAYPGGGGTYLGCPLDDPATGPGVGRSYCFTPTATTLLVNGPTSACGTPSSNSINAGNYQPVESFANLIGSTLNGNWSLIVTDNLGIDNGYIFSWGINFDSSILPTDYSFTPTLDHAFWTPDPSIVSTSGQTITVTPTVSGSNCYTYNVVDNFGCTYSQQVCIDVTPGVVLTTNTASPLIVNNGGNGTFTLTGGTPNAIVTYNINGGANQQVTLDVDGSATINISNITVNTTLTATLVAEQPVPTTGGVIAATGGVNPNNSIGAISLAGAAANTANCSTINATNPLLTLTLGHELPPGTVITISIAKNTNTGSVRISDGINSQTFNTGTNNVLQYITFTMGRLTDIITITRLNGNVYVDGITYSFNNPGCDAPLNLPATIQVATPPNPFITSITHDSYICIGSNAVFNILGSANTTVTYSINGGANQTVNLASTGVGTITVSAPTTNVVLSISQLIMGTVTTNVSLIETVIVNPSGQVNTISDEVVCNGGNTTAVNFSTTNTGGTTTYTWTNDNPAIGLASSSVGNVPGLPSFVATNTTTSPITGTITVTPTFTNGSVSCVGATRTFTITVNPTPTLILSSSVASANQTICINTSISPIQYTFGSGATGVNVTGLPSGLSVDITGSIVTISGTPIIASAATFNYTITATGSSCGSPVLLGSITLTDGILPIFNPVAPVCEGSTINIPSTSTNGIVGTWQLISSTPNDVTYEFTPNLGQCALNTQMTIVVHPLPTVIPSVTTQSFCSGGTTSINLTSNVSGVTFSWTATATSITGQSGSVIGSGATSINQTLVLNANQVAAGQVTYVIVAEANGCVGAPITVVVTVNPIPNVNVSSTVQTICSGEATNISFSGAINNTIYSWNVLSSIGVSGAMNSVGNSINQVLTTTGLSQGTVVYEVTPSLNGCVGTPQIITVTVNPVPEIFGSATHPDLCSRELTFISVSTYNTATVFNWTVDAVGVSGATAGTATGSAILIEQQLTTTGNTRGYVDYIITPVLSGCSGNPITVRVYVNPLPIVKLTDGTICVDAAGTPYQTYTLNSGLDNTNYDFVWYFEGVVIPNSNDAVYIANAIGTYSVVATNSLTNCISNIESATITATNPATSFTIIQSEYFSEDATIFVNVTGGNGTLLYQLDQGVLQESNVFTGVTGGTHDITVVDTQGCTYLTQKVLVIDYPKYFTPNGDGYNDTWNIIGLNQPDAKLYIFDRYGKLLKQLSATTASEGWNGIYNNEKLPSTDYWFTLDYTENGTQKQFKAHFSLKR